VTTFDSARAENLLAERKRLLVEAEGPMPLEALLISALLPILVEFPDFNASLVGLMSCTASNTTLASPPTPTTASPCPSLKEQMIFRFTIWPTPSSGWRNRPKGAN
jgi:hypothetical protein